MAEELVVTMTRPEEIGEGSFDPENMPAGYMLGPDQKTAVREPDWAKTAKRPEELGYEDKVIVPHMGERHPGAPGGGGVDWGPQTAVQYGVDERGGPTATMALPSGWVEKAQPAPVLDDPIAGQVNEEIANQYKSGVVYNSIIAAGHQDPHIAMETDAPVIGEDEEVNLEDIYLNEWEYDPSKQAAEQTGATFNYLSQIVYDWLHKRGKTLVRPQAAAALDVTPIGVSSSSVVRENVRQAYGLFAHQIDNAAEEQRLALAAEVQGADISRFGLEWAAQLMYSDIGMLRGYLRAEDIPEDVAMAQAALLEMYHNLGDFTGRGTIRFLKNIIANPSTYLGFGSIGVVKNLFAQGGGQALRQSMKQRLMRTALGSSIIGTEASAYGVGADYIQQVLEHGGSEEPFVWNKQRSLIAAGIGFVAGAAISAAAGPAVRSASKLVRQLKSGTAPAGLSIEDVTPGGAAAALEPVTQATDLSPAGFYSAVRRAVDALPQEKGGASQMRAMIAKSEGVKAEEMAWIGLDDFLKGRKNVTKQEIADFVDANQVEVVQITKDLDQAAAREESMLLQEQHKAGEITDYELFAGETAISARTAQYATEADNVNLPGGENYREVLLTLPQRSLPPPLRGGAFAEAHGYDLDQVLQVNTPEGEHWQRAIREAGQDDSQRNFTAGHMDEPNVLAWVRMDDRTGPNGERILFVEEIQSDWHQLGRQKGYKKDTSNLDRELDFVESQLDELAPKSKANKDHIDAGGDRSQLPFPNIGRDIENFTDRRAELVSDMAKFKDGVPDAPLKKTWHEMSLRRVIRMAAEEGYDSVAWTPGKMQVERYDLSRQVKELRAQKHGDGTYSFGYIPPEGGNRRKLKTFVPDEGMDALVGKEMADKIRKQTDEIVDYSGLDLQVGGGFHKTLYDKMLKAFAAKFGKKFGAKVGTTKIDRQTDDIVDYSGPLVSDDVRVFHDLSEEFWSDLSLNKRQQLRREAEEARTGLVEVWTIPITPKMRESVLKKGVPLFSAAGAATATGAVLSEQGTEPAL